jgi:hypothetical protein
MCLDHLINLSSAVLGNPKNVFREALDFARHFSATLPKRLAYLIGHLLANVRLKEHLQRQFAGFAAGAHGRKAVVRRRSCVVRKIKTAVRRRRSFASKTVGDNFSLQEENSASET